MKRTISNRLFQVGFWLFVVGCGPLLAIGLASLLGLLSDPNPNPVGLGLLFYFTFWPSVILMGLGIIQTWWRWWRQKPHP